MMPTHRPLLLALALCGAACTTPAQPPPDPAPVDPPGGEAAVSVSETVRAAMDTSADPCQDFYRYACGGWLDGTQIPSDRASWSRGFDVIWDQNRDAMRAIVEDAADRETLEPAHRQLADFYAACAAQDVIEARGVDPLKPTLDRISAVADLDGLMTLTADLHMVDVDILFSTFVGADYKDPDANILAVFQGGLGLPDRDYYLADDPNLAALREAYAGHVTQMMGFLGAGDAAASQAEKIIAFETELARFSTPLTELRDPEKRYNKISREALQALTPHLKWDVYFSAMGAAPFTELNVATPDFFTGLDALLAQTDLDTVKTYLSWQVIHANANLLSKEVDDANFAFYGRMLQGRQEQADRWKRCTTATGFALGDSMSRYFVEREFPGDSKAISLEMIKAIEEGFADALPQIAWMDDDTRARALDKMRAISNKIGYPATWDDYSSIEVKPDTYFENTQNTRRYESEDYIGRIGKPVDPDEWFMPAFLVNAYYNPSENEIVFPAGILQAPFFDMKHPAAMNFGGIGMVMGHELTHGFDDSGRKFDAQGKMVEWWAPEVAERFEAAASCVSDLYGGFEIREGLNLNGELTLGENIADLGGIKQSYHAWKAYTAEHGVGESVEGLTDDQLFFVAFAQSWCTLSTPEMEEVLARTDSHSPPRFRVNGPVSNFSTFGEAFGCEVGSPMRPANMCQVW